MNNLKEQLLEKATEAFIMAVELYNKPTIKYRVEGFSLFICNAWELMLKAHMIDLFGDESIYFKNNPYRTLSLENCIQKVFTNNKAPLRKNLEKIIELRNTSTHFITEEYEMVYVPLFQACILNFTEKIQTFHNVDMTKIIPQNFLTLSVSMKSLNETEIIAKYPEQIAEKILERKTSIDDLTLSNNEKFAIKIEHYHYITKDREKATSIVKIDNNANSTVRIIHDIKDPNNTHKYTAKSCINAICERISREHMTLYFNNIKTKFNCYHFTNFCKYYGIKENNKLCYVHKQFKSPTYTYSQQTIDFIVDEIKKDPQNILNNIKNKLTPGAKEF